MAMYARMHAPLLLPCGPCMPPYMAMYARMHAPLLLPYMPHVCAHACPIAAPMWPIAAPIYGLSMRAYMPYCCSDVAHIYPHIWPICARIYTPLSGTKIRTIRKAVKKRQALYLIWTSLLALAIYKVAYKGKNKLYIYIYIPHYSPYI